MPRHFEAHDVMMAYIDEDDDWPAIVVDIGSGHVKYGFAGDDEPKVIIPSAVGRYLDQSESKMSGYDDDDDDGPDALVVDNGTGVMQAGFAGDKTCRAVLPSRVGRYKKSYSGVRTGETFIGDAIYKRREALSLNYPIEHGIVRDWDDMEKIWHYLFDVDLRVDTAEHPVLMTEPPRNPMYNRQKMAQIMFETFQIPAFYVANPALLSLYASGRVSGFVIETGAGVTQTLAVYEGYCMKEATHRTGLAGREMTNYLMRLLNKRGYSFSTSAEREIVREIKERCCYVAEDFEREMSTNQKRTENYQLPDGQEIELGKETFQCMEAMFKPTMLNPDGGAKCAKSTYRSGITDIAHCGLQRCDPDTRRTLYENVIITGGNSMHRGFGERVKRELVNRGVPRETLKVICPPERRKSVWIGGSILASLSNYRGMWITKKDYQEYGPTVVYNNSFRIFDPEKG
ncbi:actin-like isoform X2 [Lytechinus variegatus]|uniref:actin-like isoform X2 n=1 Tax=Lytechinus variegatus TaxID=7654 RepID=UPI001BB26DDD|nr:actin-like isoform X2 [Lytechinus variegatus]